MAIEVVCAVDGNHVGRESDKLITQPDSVESGFESAKYA